MILALVKKSLFFSYTNTEWCTIFFTSIKRPVSLSRFTYCSVLGLKT